MLGGGGGGVEDKVLGNVVFGVVNDGPVIALGGYRTGCSFDGYGKVMVRRFFFLALVWMIIISCGQISCILSWLYV